MDPTLESELLEVLSKQQIAELCARYMRGLDRLDAALIGSVFHDDARVNYGFFKGTAHDFVDFAIRALKDHLANHHMIGQTLIEIDGDTAQGEIYFQAFHRVIEDGAEKDLFISGRYLDRYHRRDGTWKISFRGEVNDWARTEPAADDFFATTPSAIRGARGPDDPSNQRKRLESDPQ